MKTITKSVYPTFAAFALSCFWLSQIAQGVSPAPDGGYDGANTAEGTNALFSLTTGLYNTAVGSNALYRDTAGGRNTANGCNALLFNTTGSSSTAIGTNALYYNTTGANNVAIGDSVLSSNITGSGNIAINNSTASNTIDRIDIAGLPSGESNAITIGCTAAECDYLHAGQRVFIAGCRAPVTGSAVVANVETSTQLGVAPSSQRFKEEIKPMDKASEAILALKPVTFRYKKKLDPERTPQFGLVAEEVKKVNPNLVTRDAKGQAYTVRYDAVNAALLNEFFKEHRKVEEQEATIAELQSTVAQQQKAVEAFAAILKERASQIQKVSAQLELSKPGSRIVDKNQ